LKTISPGWTPSGSTFQVALLSESEFTNVIATLKLAADANVLNSPQIMTSSGVQAEAFMGEEVPFNGTNAACGIHLAINPLVTSGSPILELDLANRLSQVIDYSPLKDGSDRRFRQIAANTRVSLMEGQTVVMERDLAGDEWAAESIASVPGPKSLLIFLTPRLVVDGPEERYRRQPGRTELPPVRMNPNADAALAPAIRSTPRGEPGL
jgi:hypothetical protein